MKTTRVQGPLIDVVREDVGDHRLCGQWRWCLCLRVSLKGDNVMEVDNVMVIMAEWHYIPHSPMLTRGANSIV